MKLLTVYYSYGGNTKRVAELAHARLGGELVRIETAEPYAGNYDQVVEQGKREVERGFCPALKPLEIDWDAFDTVVLGMPVWWYTFAPAMHSVPRRRVRRGTYFARVGAKSLCQRSPNGLL